MEGIKPPAEFVPYSNEKKRETWRESFEIFAIAVNLESMPLVRQRAILKHIAGEKTVMIYKTFHISENDTYPNVKEMLDMFTNHFKPFKNTIQRRNAFFTCVQKERQGIMEFVTELKHLAQECEFENLTESLIRDRLIIGILDREVKRKLLEDPQLTLPRAISIAMISESTCSQVASLNEQKMIEKIEKRNWVKDTIRMENAEAGPSGINPRRERIIEPLVCRTKRIRNLLAESEAEESCDQINLNEVAVKTVRSDKWSATIIINGKKTTVHLDTGAQINVLPHKVINQWPSRPEIRPTSLKAFAYGNTELPVVGKCNVLYLYGEKKEMFEFIVADVEAQTLITGDTCEKLEILRRINHINTDEMKLCSETQKILEQYHEVFQGVGLINSECKIYTKPEYSPVQVPPRRIPTSLGAEVQSELEKMVKQGIVTKIYHETEWSHPMVVVKKKSGQIRICLDPRKLNEALVGRHFQTPAPAELLHEIPKAKYYTVLDVKSAYWHIPVAKECRDLLVMTTPFGKFRYNRLPFGLKISAQIFVEKMTNIFRDSFQNITYVDDLLIYADTIQEHNKKLKGIQEKNIKFDLTKARICLTKVRFLGHLISQNGINPEPNKIDKLITFKRPEDKKSLQRIMGLYNYLGKFIPNLAASTSNIRGILRKNVVWHWGPKQDREFDHIKECVRNAPSLAHFDKSKMLILQCDASKDAMGAALLQEDRPLAFASASFSDSQKQYSQIEKELLSVYYGCKKFEYLLSGHTFVVQTDHQPLLPLVKKPLSDISPRLQRLVMKLIAFDFKLQYKPGKYLIVADTLSRDTHPMDELPTPFLEDKRMVKMRLAPGFYRRVKAKTSLQDDDVPIDDTKTKPLFTPQEKGRKEIFTTQKVGNPISYKNCNNCHNTQLTPDHIYPAILATLYMADINPEEDIHTDEIPLLDGIVIRVHGPICSMDKTLPQPQLAGIVTRVHGPICSMDKTLPQPQLAGIVTRVHGPICSMDKTLPQPQLAGIVIRVHGPICSMDKTLPQPQLAGIVTRVHRPICSMDKTLPQPQLAGIVTRVHGLICSMDKTLPQPQLAGIVTRVQGPICSMDKTLPQPQLAGIVTRVHGPICSMDKTLPQPQLAGIVTRVHGPICSMDKTLPQPQLAGIVTRVHGPICSMDKTLPQPQLAGIVTRVHGPICSMDKTLPQPQLAGIVTRVHGPICSMDKTLPPLFDRSDKGSRTVIMNTTDYISGMNQILSNSDVFTPATAEEQTVSNSKYKKELRTLCRNKIITTDELQGFLSNLHGQAYIYGLPKPR
ncbi:K02A2.6-like [Cordylochernes scorpioides]|uniref:K02A2.6-like n=1 Tax=Cordylochernes scorpioides TaxID=51811 RepID=A0ABY6KPY3_9ARAC|nr:K02A2.6-like [Cordylochernes scorpioides]